MHNNFIKKAILFVVAVVVVLFGTHFLFNFVHAYVGILFAFVGFGSIAYVAWRELAKLLTLALVVASMAGNQSCTRIEPQYDGVLVSNYGQNPETDYTTQKGTVWTAGPGTFVIEIPAWEQRGDLEPFDITTRDGGVFKVDPFYTYQRKVGFAPKIAANYRRMNSTGEELLDLVEQEILNPRIRNLYLETARNFTTDSLLYNMTIYERAVEARSKAELDTAFFVLRTLSSSLLPPESLQKRIEERNAVRQETEKTLNQAMQERAKLEVVRLQAEQNLLYAKSLTPELLTVKKLELQYKQVELQEKTMWAQRDIAYWWREAGCPMPSTLLLSGGTGDPTANQLNLLTPFLLPKPKE